jgi:uncharacterized protein YjiS (DUF1127 family)
MISQPLHHRNQQKEKLVPGISERRLQPLGKRIRAMFIAAPQFIAEWRQRVRTHNKLTALSDGDLRDAGRTRAEVEAERCKAFLW